MSSYAFFMQTCWEEHKKQHLDASVNSEFSSGQRWTTMSAKEKGRFEDMAKAAKARYEREMKTSTFQRGDQKVQGPQCTQETSSSWSGSTSPIKAESPGLSFGAIAKTLGEMWKRTAVGDRQS